MTFSILETPDWEVEAEMAGKFRNDFAFDERERLLGCECLFFLIFLLTAAFGCRCANSIAIF